MQIHQLRTFLAVARLAHLTRAAEQLHLTQSALSKQLKALEEELGVILFDRTAAGMALTRAGILLLPVAERTLASALDMTELAKGLRGEIAGRLRLGTIIDPEYLRLGEVLGALMKYYPLIEIKLAHAISGQVLERVSSGELDCGFYLGRVDANEMHAVQLKVLRYLVVAPRLWQSKIDAADWTALSQMPWVGTPPQSSQHRLVKEMFGEHRLDVNVVIEADQEVSMISLARTGVALCLMREELAEAAFERGEIAIWRKTERLCPLSFIHLKARVQDVSIAAFARVMQDVWLA
jgi:DNA-binding transcriptional LysR family regulator